MEIKDLINIKINLFGKEISEVKYKFGVKVLKKVKKVLLGKFYVFLRFFYVNFFSSYVFFYVILRFF